MARHLLDHASTSPLRPEAAESLEAWTALAALGQLGGERFSAIGLTARAITQLEAPRQAQFIGYLLRQRADQFDRSRALSAQRDRSATEF